MPNFSGLPTELRHEILKHVVEAPLVSPTDPDEVVFVPWTWHVWWAPHYHVWFNVGPPWNRKKLALLPVNKAYKADIEQILTRVTRVHAVLDLVPCREKQPYPSYRPLVATWLRPPPFPRDKLECLEVRLRNAENFPLKERSFSDNCRNDLSKILIVLIEEILTISSRPISVEALHRRPRASIHVNVLRICLEDPIGIGANTPWLYGSENEMANNRPSFRDTAYHLLHNCTTGEFHWDRSCDFISMMEVYVGEDRAFSLHNPETEKGEERRFNLDVNGDFFRKHGLIVFLDSRRQINVDDVDGKKLFWWTLYSGKRNAY